MRPDQSCSEGPGWRSTDGPVDQAGDGRKQKSDAMGMVGQKAVRPIMLVRRAVAMAVAAFSTKDLHRGVRGVGGAASEPLALGLKRGKPRSRWVGAGAMRPGMPNLAQKPGQEHQGREHKPNTTGHAECHAAARSICAPRLSITEAIAPPGGGYGGTPKAARGHSRS